MANIYSEQRLIDNAQRCLIKITGNVDGNNAANLVVVDVSTLALALNSNGYIMTSNTDPRPTYNVSIRRIYGDINMSGIVKIGWYGDANTDALILGPTAINIDMVDSKLTNPGGANVSGDIILSTVGAGANNSYTLFLDLRKDRSHYDQGQTADPKAFNR